MKRIFVVCYDLMECIYMVFTRPYTTFGRCRALFSPSTAYPFLREGNLIFFFSISIKYLRLDEDTLGSHESHTLVLKQKPNTNGTLDKNSSTFYFDYLLPGTWGVFTGGHSCVRDC
ncbi:unnamed protein product [Ixodes pacificus]